MPLGFPFLKASIKTLFIEGSSLGFAFLVDHLLLDLEEDEHIIRFSIDARIYYLAKNILQQIDILLSKEKDYRPLYGGIFNLSIAAMIHPAYRLPKLNNETVNIITAGCLLYFGASLLRLIVEMGVSKQTFKQHILMHRGKLTGGVLGIIISLIPTFGIATPSWYWSGELYDVWRNKDLNETFQSILLRPKSTVPIQVILAAVIKVAVNFSNKTLAFPNVTIDFLIGTIHRLVSNGLERAPQNIPLATAQTPASQLQLQVPGSTTVNITIAEDNERLISSPQELKHNENTRTLSTPNSFSQSRVVFFSDKQYIVKHENKTASQVQDSILIGSNIGH